MSDWSAGPQRGRRPQGRGNYDYYRQSRGAPPPGRGPQRPQSPNRPDDRRRQQDPRRQQDGRRPGDRGPGGQRPPAGRKRKQKHWGRRIGIAVAVVVLLLGGLVFYFDSMLQRVPALAANSQNADTPGANWLLVGSDSRQGMDEAQKDELGTGDASGKRTDTMVLVHVPAGGGQPSMVSFPRDSSVQVPGHGREKINAAYTQGGSELLSQTVEQNTGVHIDHYAEVGLGGFSNLVDSVGGVNVCVDQPMHDEAAGVNLEPGCQDMDGPTALGFVRDRHDVKGGDLGRAANQRKVLGALVDQATSPATLLNPFRLFPLASNATETFTVNESDHVWHLGSLAMAMGDISGGEGVQTGVPFGSFARDDNGQSVIQWDRQDASRMFDAIARDEPIPPDLLP